MSRKPPPPVYGWWPSKPDHEPRRAFDKLSQIYCPECHPTGPAYSPTLRPVPLEPPNRRRGYGTRYPDWFYYCGECGYPVKQLAECSNGVPFEMKQNSVAPPKPNTSGTMTLAQLKRKYGYVAPSASRERAWIPPPPRPPPGFGERLRRSLSRIFCGYNNNHSATIDPRGSMRAPALAFNYDRNWPSFGTVTQPRNINSPHIIPWDDPPNATRSPAKSSRQALPIRFHTTIQPNYQPSSSSYPGTTSTASSSKDDDDDEDDSALSVAPDEKEEEQASPVFLPGGSSFAAIRYNQKAPTSRFITGTYRPSAMRQLTPWAVHESMQDPPRYPAGRQQQQYQVDVGRYGYNQEELELEPEPWTLVPTTEQEPAGQEYNQQTDDEGQTVPPGRGSTRGPSPFQVGTPFSTSGKWSPQTEAQKAGQVQKVGASPEPKHRSFNEDQHGFGGTAQHSIKCSSASSYEKVSTIAFVKKVNALKNNEKSNFELTGKVVPRKPQSMSKRH